jgi:hypothetical protein
VPMCHTLTAERWESHQIRHVKTAKQPCALSFLLFRLAINGLNAAVIGSSSLTAEDDLGVQRPTAIRELIESSFKSMMTLPK